MPERSPIDIVGRLLSYSITGLVLFITLDSYDRQNGGPGIRERVRKMFPARASKVRTWDQLTEAEREHARRRVIVEAWNAAEGRYERE